ncbi:MAG: hypothetical protein LC122_02630 [Chitinophagales bacterium]|nr:hypothetical protein [Chitinophagales bacterium]
MYFQIVGEKAPFYIDINKESLIELNIGDKINLSKNEYVKYKCSGRFRVIDKEYLIDWYHKTVKLQYLIIDDNFFDDKNNKALDLT